MTGQGNDVKMTRIPNESRAIWVEQMAYKMNVQAIWIEFVHSLGHREVKMKTNK